MAWHLEKPSLPWTKPNNMSLSLKVNNALLAWLLTFIILPKRIKYINYNTEVHKNQTWNKRGKMQVKNRIQWKIIWFKVINHLTLISNKCSLSVVSADMPSLRQCSITSCWIFNYRSVWGSLKTNSENVKFFLSVSGPYPATQIPAECFCQSRDTHNFRTVTLD